MNSTIPPFSIRKPIHCWDNFTGGETNKTYASDILLLLASTESPDCYPHLNKEQKNNFLVYEEIVGGYCNCLVGFIGIIGNIVCLIVLCQKELQKNNCFNKLLVGKLKRKAFDNDVKGQCCTSLIFQPHAKLWRTTTELRRNAPKLLTIQNYSVCDNAWMD